MNADLVKITEIILVPNSILVGALGLAATEPLKTGISTLGLVVSILWGICSWDAAKANSSVRESVLAWLPVLFIACWLVAAIVHGRLWRRLPHQPKI